MTLRTELVKAEVEQLDHLSTESLSCLETLSKEHDLGNHVFVRLHHGHLAEKLFEIVRQVRTASVIRVHSDEDSHGLVQTEFFIHQVNALSVLFQAHLNGQNLLRYGRQHAFFQTVELIEASPGAHLAESNEDATHSLAIEGLIAVEHKSEATHLHAQSFD